jgi:transcription initiation factor TFIIB
LNLPKQVQKLAELIVGKASNIESINGKSPVSLAAAAIYIASEVTSNSRSLEDISKICGAAVTTIKITCKPIQQNLNEILPNEYKSQSLKTITNSKI